MSEYVHDIFYKVHTLPIEDQKQLLRDVHAVCYEWWVDEIPENSTQRRRSKREFDIEEIINMLSKGSHIVFIHRRGYPDTGTTYWKWKLECGYVGGNDHGYYLFINADQKYVEEFVKKYKLIPL